jgi:hypothetical protein
MAWLMDPLEEADSETNTSNNDDNSQVDGGDR